MVELSEWLALRRRADFAARSSVLTAIIADRLGTLRPLRILDLGTGTGSNIRYLAPKLGGQQQWLAIDKDSSLLGQRVTDAEAISEDLQIEARVMDLDTLDSTDIFEGRQLVTASALLDLVSEQWLRRVAAACWRVGACALFTLTYNGRNECDPADPYDAIAFDLFNRHQLRDKGLGGTAAGPFATEVARRTFNDLGFDVRLDSSDWHVDQSEPELQRELIEGWAGAAAEVEPEEASRISAWRQRRLDHVDADRSRIVVGHYDLSAVRNRA